MEFKWTPDLSVGVDLIDNQHQELFKRINALRAAMSQGKGKLEIGKTLTFLEDYVVEHFTTEERHMRVHDYAAYPAHKAEHAAFVKEFLEFKKRFEALESQGAITSFATIEIQRRLVDWLLNHIGKVDKALGTFLSSKGA